MNDDKAPAPTPATMRQLAQQSREIVAETLEEVLARPNRGGLLELTHIAGYRAGIDAMAQALEAWADEIEGDEQ